MKNFDEARRLILSKMEEEIEHLRIEEFFVNNMPEPLKGLELNHVMGKAFQSCDGSLSFKVETEAEAMAVIKQLDLLPMVIHRGEYTVILSEDMVARKKEYYKGTCRSISPVVYDLEFFAGKYYKNVISAYILIKNYIVEIKFSITKPETCLRVSLETSSKSNKTVKEDGRKKVYEWWVDNNTMFTNRILWDNYGLTDSVAITLYDFVHS
jgi:hypothetical protein